MSDAPRPWIDAWHDALYGDRGFYRRAEGPAAHFATSAQGIPGVSQILAQAVVALAERHGAEAIADFACGRGELVEALIPYVAPGIELVGVDVVDRPAGLDERITWVRSPGGAGVARLDALRGRRALVLAHEWLDVVPCTVAEADDGGILRRVLVGADGVERLGEPLDGSDLRWAGRFAPRCAPGERIEIGRARDAAWAALVAEVSRCAAPGSVVVGVDYAYRTTNRPPLGTLTGFRDGAECPPRPDGSCDLTAHVALDSLEPVDGPSIITQRDLLLKLFGTEALAPVPHTLATSDPPAYLERLALRSACAAAIHPDGLGGFFWFCHEIG